MTPLHWAAYHGEPKLVWILVAHGATVQSSKHKYTPVDIAGFMGKVRVVNFLAKNYAFTCLKQDTMLLRGDYETFFDGRIELENHLTYEMTKSELDAFALIIKKGNRIHNYFAMPNEDKLNPEKIEEQKDRNYS